jgi:hypothetical protein
VTRGNTRSSRQYLEARGLTRDTHTQICGQPQGVVGQQTRCPRSVDNHKGVVGQQTLCPRSVDDHKGVVGQQTLCPRSVDDHKGGRTPSGPQGGSHTCDTPLRCYLRRLPRVKTALKGGNVSPDYKPRTHFTRFQASDPFHQITSLGPISPDYKPGTHFTRFQASDHDRPLFLYF